jgi:hypothetical protein
MVTVQDGLNSMPWVSLASLPAGYHVEVALPPPRDAHKYGYDLWSNGLAFEAFGIGRTYKVTLRIDGVGDGLWLFNFDTSGRLINVSYTGTRWGSQTISYPDYDPGFRLLPYPQYRPELHRLLGGTWLRAKWTGTFDHTGLVYRPEIVPPADPFLSMALAASDLLVRLLPDVSVDRLDNRAADVLDLLRGLPVKSSNELARETERFHEILGGHIPRYIPVEPPELVWDHYHAIPLCVQTGCGGPCTFCSLYERRIQVRPFSDVKRQIELLQSYLGEEIDHFRKVVLLEGDSLTVPTDQLIQELEYSRGAFRLDPDAGFAHAFAKARTIVDRGETELRVLRAAGLMNVNVGLESGCQTVLDLVKHGQQLEDVRAAASLLGGAGIKLSLNIIAGLGGALFAEQHVHDTIQFVRTLPPGTQVFYSPLFVPGGSRYETQEERVFGRLDDEAIGKQSIVFERELGAAEYMFVAM